jgi:uncharacterized protein (TIGR01777 family)
MQTHQRLVLTGATGLIGRKLFAALQSKYDLVIFSRNPKQAQTSLPGASAYVSWTVAEQGDWAAAIDGAAAVIHLASQPISSGLIGPRWTGAYKAQIYNSRVIGTQGIVNAIEAAQQRPDVFICASAVGYYGYSETATFDENSPPGDDFVAKVCIAWEREASRAETLGVRTVFMRTGLVLDPDSGVLPQIMAPFRMRAGGPIGSGRQFHSWIHPDDEVGLFQLALQDERVSGPLNATAPNPKTNRDFSSILGRVMGVPSWLPVPDLAMRATLGEMADIVLQGQRVLPRKALDLGYQFRFPQLEAALRDLL